MLISESRVQFCPGQPPSQLAAHGQVTGHLGFPIRAMRWSWPLPRGTVVSVEGESACHLPGECWAPVRAEEMLAVTFCRFSCVKLASDAARAWLPAATWWPVRPPGFWCLLSGTGELTRQRVAVNFALPTPTPALIRDSCFCSFAHNLLSSCYVPGAGKRGQGPGQTWA